MFQVVDDESGELIYCGEDEEEPVEDEVRRCLATVPHESSWFWRCGVAGGEYSPICGFSFMFFWRGSQGGARACTHL